MQQGCIDDCGLTLSSSSPLSLSLSLSLFLRAGGAVNNDIVAAIKAEKANEEVGLRHMRPALAQVRGHHRRTHSIWDPSAESHTSCHTHKIDA